jgi:hypothetical protein
MAVPYLCTVHYGTNLPERITDAWIRNVNSWPMDGLWLETQSAYLGGPVRPASDYGSLIEYLRTNCRKDIWPAVYINPMVQFEAEKGHEQLRESTFPVFSRIRGWALDDEFGRRAAVLDMWRQQLRIARQLGSPGVAWDLEMYNNYSIGTVAKLAAIRGETEGAVQGKLQRLGADIAGVVMAEYRSCVIWDLMSPNSRLNTVFLNNVAWEPEGATPQAVVELAILDELKAKGFQGSYIEGGEGSVGYVNGTVEKLRERLVAQQAGFAWLLQRYPFVRLGATIAPWIDVARRSTWMKEPSDIRNIEAFEPFFETLLANRDFSWLYIGAGIDLNDPVHVARLTAALTKAKQAALADRAEGRVLALSDSGPALPPANRLADFESRVPLTDFATDASSGRYELTGTREGNGWRGLSITPEALGQQGYRFALEATFPRSEGTTEEWPRLSFTPTVADWSSYAGVALELRNEESEEGYIGLSIASPKGEWYKRWPVPANASVLAVVPTATISHACDLRAVTRVAVVMYTPPHDWTWRLSDNALVR